VRSTPARKARFKRWVPRLGLAVVALTVIATVVVTVVAVPIPAQVTQ
jgi:t-SNARE complex subunit (syntaxin)